MEKKKENNIDNGRVRETKSVYSNSINKIIEEPITENTPPDPKIFSEIPSY